MHWLWIGLAAITSPLWISFILVPLVVLSGLITLVSAVIFIVLFVFWLNVWVSLDNAKEETKQFLKDMKKRSLIRTALYFLKKFWKNLRSRSSF